MLHCQAAQNDSFSSFKGSWNYFIMGQQYDKSCSRESKIEEREDYFLKNDWIFFCDEHWSVMTSTSETNINIAHSTKWFVMIDTTNWWNCKQVKYQPYFSILIVHESFNFWKVYATMFEWIYILEQTELFTKFEKNHIIAMKEIQLWTTKGNHWQLLTNVSRSSIKIHKRGPAEVLRLEFLEMNSRPWMNKIRCVIHSQVTAISFLAF